MKKLGKRSSLESGTFFAYACNCNCGSVPCGTCNNCNDYKNPQSTGAYALSYVTEMQLNNMILSILVDTFISKISFPMQPGPEIGSISDA
jgi:putative bacteriocin precursor